MLRGGVGCPADRLWVQRRRWWSTAPSGTRMTTVHTATPWRVMAPPGPTAPSWCRGGRVSWSAGRGRVGGLSDPGGGSGTDFLSFLPRLPPRRLLVAHSPARVPPVAPGTAAPALLEVLCLLQGGGSPRHQGPCRWQRPSEPTCSAQPWCPPHTSLSPLPTISGWIPGSPCPGVSHVQRVTRANREGRALPTRS